MADKLEKGVDEPEIPAGLSAAVFLIVIIVSLAILTLLLYGWILSILLSILTANQVNLVQAVISVLPGPEAIIYDYADEKNVMVVGTITPNNTRHSSWTLAWFWGRIKNTKFAPWEYFVRNSTKKHHSKTASVDQLRRKRL